MIKTLSLCNTCFKEIPAAIAYEPVGVVMRKFCDQHGASYGLIENDVPFYDYWKSHNSGIYHGHFVDVTTRCNLQCKYCFYEKGNKDIPLSDILAECRKSSGPYYLTGGEPTLRRDLPEIIRQVSEIGCTYVVTNGVGFLDRNYLRECDKYLFKHNGFSGIALSFHKEFGDFGQVIENLKTENIKPHSILFVIDSLDELSEIKKVSESYNGMFEIVRIKSATNIWDEQNAKSPFASDIVKWFMYRGDTKFQPVGKTTYLPFWHNGVVYAAVKWYDVSNVDLNEIDCPPTYTAKNGETMDFVKAMITNEGMNKGWLKGNRIDTSC